MFHRLNRLSTISLIPNYAQSMKRKIYSLKNFALTALSLFTLHQSHAADYWWDSNGATAGFGNTTGTWGSNDFWSTSNAGTSAISPVVTNSSDAVNFGTTTLNYGNGTVGIATGGVSASSIVYGAGQTTAITLGTAANSLTVSTITQNHANVIQSIISPIAGTSGINKTGLGTVALSGANAYSGGSSIIEGTLVFRNLASKPASGTHVFSAATTLGLGVGGAGFTVSDLDNAFSGVMSGNLSNVSVDATTSIGIDTTSGNLSYTSAIADVNRGLTKLGTNTLTLGSNNSYSGATTVQGGTLSISSLADAGTVSSLGKFPAAGKTGLILIGSTLNYTGSSVTTNRGFTARMQASGINVSGANVNLSLGDSEYNQSSAQQFVFTTSTGSSIVISKLSSLTASMDFTTSAGANATIHEIAATGAFNIAVRTGSDMLKVGNLTNTLPASGSYWLSGLNISGNISGVQAGQNIFLGAGTPNGVTFTGNSTFDAIVNTQQTGIYSFNSIKNVGAGASALGAPTTTARGTIGFGSLTANPTLRYIGTGDTSDRVIDLRGTTGTSTLEQSGTGLLKFTSNMTATGAGAKTFVLAGSTAGTGEIAGAIVNNSTSNTTSVTKNGTGKWTLSGANTYTGTTTINGGTLALGANNVLPNSSALTMSGGILDAATFTDTAGTLAVTGSASINLGANASLTFADSSAVAWPGTLNITGTFSSSSLRFGTSGSGLTQAQMDKITVNGAGLGDYELNTSGFLIFSSAPADTAAPTPNPMTWATVPTSAGMDSITMTASTATDASGVEYFFDETSGNPGGTDSGWQSSPHYNDAGLSPSTTYTYTVTARDRSAGQNATASSAPANATTSTAPLYTVWNVQFASQTANQITTSENFIGAATENTTNSTWNRVASVPLTAMVLKNSEGVNTGVTLDFAGGSIGTQNLTSGAKIFNSRVNGNNTMTLKGLSVANSYDLVIYSDWWWKNGDSLPITQTSGSGLTGTFYLNRVLSGTNGTVLALSQDTNPGDITSGAGNTGNWMRVNGLTPTFAGELSFRITDGNNTPFNGFQLIATPIAPKADLFSMSLASNPPSIRDAVIGENTITLTVPFGTDITNVAPTYVVWPGATCTTPSGTARNFTTPQTYTVTSSDSLVTKHYTVTVLVAPPLPEFTLSAPANWNGRSAITVQPIISNLSLLQVNNGTNFTYNWSTRNLAVTQTTSPSVMTLTRAQGSGSLLVTLTMNNGTENVTQTTTITVQEPATDPWVERTPLANEKPVANQFFARNPFTNMGTIFYRGTQSGSPDDVFLKIYRTPSGGSETLYATHRQTLTGGTYAFTATIEAGLATYRVVYGTRTASVDSDVATVNGMLCGDAFIISGQSNAQATDTGSPQVDTSDPWVKTYDATLGWGPAYARPTSPNWGSKVGFWAMKLAQDLTMQHAIPICIINGAVGGTRIDQHQPNPANRTVGAGTYDIYANLLNRVIAARLTHGIRAAFWHQGESDSSTFGPPIEPDHLFYQQQFLSMTSAWKEDFPNFQRYLIFQIAPNPCSIGPFASEVREIHRTLPRLFSNMSIVATLAIPGYDGCHYSIAGYQTLAARTLPVINRDIYGVNSPSAVTSPNLVRASFTSSARTAIALLFDQPMSWSNFSLPNYHINDVSNLVSSGSASGNTVTLQLSSAVAENSTIDYVKDTWNFTESVSTLLFGANALPALTFANVPIEALSPYQSWSNSKNLSGLDANIDADPDGDGIANILEYILGGEPNSANPGSNSSSLLPISSTNSSGDMIFRFKRKRESIGNANLAFHWTVDLTFQAPNSLPIGSSSSSSNGVSVAISSFDATTDDIVITVPSNKAVNGKLFGKLRATATED